MVRGAFSNDLAPGYRKIIFETYKERATEGDKIINMSKSSRAYERDFPIAGFGTLLKKVEGGSVTFQDAIEGNPKVYNWSTYGLGFRITQELMEDDLYGIFGGKMSKAIGRSARNNFEVIAHAVLNNAFSTSFAGFVSGESLLGDHLTLRGATIRNRPVTDADIGLLPLQASIEHFHALNDESGIPAVFIPKRVIYSVGDHWIISQLLKSSNLPGSNFNDVNQLANEGLMPHLSHYLTDADAWYIQCDQHDTNYFDRRAPTFSNSDDFRSGDALFKLTRRNGSGWGDWRGMYGSQGA